MIEISDKKDCCGCGGCFQRCPVHCIDMQADDEGFLYPYVDKEKCISCKACEKTCPIINKKEHESLGKIYGLANKDQQIRMESASGGSFSLFANYVFSLNGIVYGAAYDSDMRVNIIGVEDRRLLPKLIGSKYVQSNTCNVFKEVKAHLKTGRIVLYSGTPCQIAGLVNFLGKKYENLITFDFACHGVPSPKVFNKYITSLEGKYGKKIIDYKFRTKNHGYDEKSCDYARIEFEDGNKIYACEAGKDELFMTKAFFSEISSRPSCSKCVFKGLNHVSDFTAFDCWHTKQLCPELNDNKGVTSLIINTIEGKNLFETVKKNASFIELDLKKAIYLDGISLIYSIPQNQKRTSFFNNLDTKDIGSLYDLYLKNKGLKKVKSIIKTLLNGIGILTLLRDLKYKNK